MQQNPLGLALLLKFSLVLLVPWWAALLLLWRGLEPARRRSYRGGTLLISGSAALLVLLPYGWMTAHYPPERQFRDTGCEYEWNRKLGSWITSL